jgi:transcription elongation factor GreB
MPDTFCLFQCSPRIRPGKTTRCEKGLRENHTRTSPRREARTTSRGAACSASKTSTGFCSPGNARPWWRWWHGLPANGDRSENADYQYGKRRLRQIDGRIRFLTKRIEAAEVVDPEAPRAGQAATRAFFGATVRYANAAGAERVVSIVGTDEVDLNRNHISWVSPLGRALMKSAAGDSVVLQLPGGTEYLTVLEVCYERISVEPFREPPGSEASAKGLPRRRSPD